MFEQMEESVDRCWAYNKSGQRCELVAGHDRDHSVIIAWGSDECWTPGTEFIIPMASRATVEDNPIEHLTPGPPPGSGRCGICEHPHHPDGTCGADDGGFECDCSHSVED